jgi:hypothetical protein
MPNGTLRLPQTSSNSHGFQGSSGSFLVPAGGRTPQIGLIDDGVLRFDSAAGARWYLDQTRKGALLTHAHLTAVRVGSGGVTWAEGGTRRSQANFLFWRNGRYVAEVSLVFRGHAQFAPTLTLARILDRKVQSAQ